MITEDYVSFETAKLLKEKGFDVWCDKCYGTALYHKGVPISFDDECELKEAGLENEIEYVEGGYLYDFGCDNRKEYAKVYAAPTLQMTMKWLREVHRIIIVIQPLSFNGAKDFLCDNWVYSVWLGVNLKIGESLKNQNTSSTYEEACEAAIKYCLENLIYKKR